MQPARLGAWMACLVSTALFAALMAPPGSAQTIESSQQTNDRIRSLAAASRSTLARDYVIRTGALLAIQVFDVPQLSRALRVSQPGPTCLPLARLRLHASE